MQKPSDKGDYGITPTDEEKSRLSGQEQEGPTALNDDKKQNGTDEEDGTDRDHGRANEGQDNPAERVTTPPQEGGR